MMKRRALLIGAAAALGAGAAVWKPRTVWSGRAFGADVRMVLDGAGAPEALRAARAVMRRLEGQFSLYDPGSALSQLNREGRLAMASDMARLVAVAGTVNAATDGLFDPSIQPIFAAMLRRGGRLGRRDREALAHRIGWRHVRVEGSRLRFARPAMALTLNGIAQGYASDRVAETLAAHGFADAFVDMGEPRGHLTVEVEGRTGTLKVAPRGSALATTHARGFAFPDGTGHLIGGVGRYSRVTVQARSAAMADGFSTALAMAGDDGLARRLIRAGLVERVWLDGSELSRS